MDRETLRNMDQNKYQGMLEDAAFDQVDDMLNISKGHSRDLHENLSNEKLIQRIISEDKDNTSCFWDEETLKEGISNVVAYRSDEITNWLFKNRFEFQSPKDYQTICIAADIGGDSIGHGFVKEKDNIIEKETSAVKVILQRDMDGESPFGFYIKTAYADIEYPSSIRTGLEYSKENIVNNPNIIFDSDISKLYYTINGKYDNITMFQRTDTKTRKPYLKIIFPEKDNERIEAFITDKETNIRVINESEVKKISYADCFFHHTEESKILSDIKNIQNILKDKTLDISLEKEYIDH